MGVIVTGIGVVSSLGANTGAFRRALLAAECPCRPHPFRRLDASVVTAPAYIAQPADAAGLIEPKKLRRMFRLARMSAVASRQALQQAGLDPAGMDPAKLGVVFGTSMGALEVTQKFVDSWLEQGAQHASPLQFMNSVHGILASQVALDIHATGVNLTTAQRDICFEAALDTACSLLEQRRADVILVGGADELTDLLHECGSRLHQFTLDLSQQGIDPDASRGTVIPGDGAAVAVLERDDSPRAALARIERTALGRHDVGSDDVASLAMKSAGAVDLVTTARDGTSRSAIAYRGARYAVPSVSHLGSFGQYASAGAQQFAANVLMLHHGEGYAPLANGRPVSDRVAPTRILHDARSISGNHAAYVVSRA
ncbi:MAG: beta-ketoacyl synthase chain length factor [Planctomycetes bacterium]|nr:beta-ketoacyl synthase chain length factor [Planctomycetota bacterium]